jgi:hypothetical protein
MFRFAQHDKVKAEGMTARHCAVSREKTNARSNVSFYPNCHPEQSEGSLIISAR